MGFSWRGGDVGGLRRLGSGLEPRELRSAAARAVRASFAELDRLEVGALYRSDIHSVSIAEKTAPFSSECFFENTFLLASSVSQKRCFLANLLYILWVTTQTQRFLILITQKKKIRSRGVA